MNKYQTLYDIFSRFPNASYEECLKEISGLTKPYYNKHKSLYKKAIRKEEERDKRKKGKKSKHNKNGAGAIHPLTKKTKNKSGIGTTSISPAPTQLSELDPDKILIMGMTKQIPLDPALFRLYYEIGLYRKDKEKSSGERYIYKEPAWLYKCQQQALSIMREGNIFLYGARQLSGKTTTALIGIFEKCYEYENSLVVHISVSKDLSKELIGKAYNDPRLYEIYKETATMFHRESIHFKNHSKLLIRPCKMSALQGLTARIVWIDELDKILMERETREAFASILPVIITFLLKGEGHLWITTNQAPASHPGGLEFEYIKTILLKFGKFMPVCEIVEPTPARKERELLILNDFDPKIPVDPFEKERWFVNFMYELQEAVAGEEFAKAQMLNLYEDKTGLWKKVDVINAFSSYDESKVPAWDLREISGQAIDPGAQHGTGYAEGFRDMKGEIWITYVRKYFHTEITEDEFKQVVADRADELNSDIILCESSYGGLWWINHWSEMGYHVEAANFGTANPKTGDTSNATKAIERHYKERTLKHFMETKKIHIVKDKILIREFSLYNPTEDKEKGKGDLIDAILHLVFKLAGGVDFVLELMEGKEGIEQTDGYNL